MVEPTNVNAKGKVIVPLPDLCQGLSEHTIKFDRNRYAKSLYVYGITSLIADLKDNFTISKDNSGKWRWLDYSSQVNPYLGYAVFDSFETYHIVPVCYPVNFTLGDKSDWSRPYDFGIFYHNSTKKLVSDNFDIGQQVSVLSSMVYPTVLESRSIKGKSDSKSVAARTDLGIIKSMNVRTSNAFLYKFGIQLANPDLQRFTDTGSSFLADFTR